MYELRIGNDTIYKPGVSDLVMASSPQVTFELNTQGMLDLQMQSSHPFYSKITQHKTVIDLYDSNEWLAAFRVINVDVDFYNIKTVECNGVLDFLNDTIVRPFQFTGSITNLLKKILDNHNSQVDEFKKIYLGQVTVVDTNNYVNRSSGNYMNTLECINDRLIKSHGGYLRIRKVNGKYYLDYISDYGVVSKQTIRFGENLLDLNNYIQGDTLATAIIPLGAELEENGINDVKKRVTIESVNNGKDYIYSTEGVKQFGYVWQTVTWDDVTQPSNLLNKAKQYLSENANMDISIEIKAIDLAYIDINISMIKLGDWIPVESFPHNLQRNFLVSKLEIDIENPEKSIINLGSVIGTFTSDTTSSNKNVQSSIRDELENVYVWYNDAIQKATDLINGGTGGYVYTATNVDGQPNEIYIMDKPQVDQAKNLIRLNVNGIGFSNNGINGSYRNAWTIDGKLNADFITTGTLRAVKLIGNEIEGASIKGGKIVGGSITGETSINVGTDLFVGNNIYLGKGSTSLKEIYLSDRLRFRRATGISECLDIVNTYTGQGWIALRMPKTQVIVTQTDISLISNNASNSFQVSPQSTYSRLPITIGSDKRMKSCIKDIDISDLVDSVTVKSFKYQETEKQKVGVIAQDYLGSEFEQYVIDKNEDGYLCVDYNAFLMSVIQKIQKQEARIKELERKING